MSLTFEAVDFRSLSQCNIGKIHTLLCKAFNGHFTSLLSQQQLERYFFTMSHSARYAKCHLAVEGDEIAGFAVLGAEVSLLSIFQKINSLESLSGVVLLCMRLAKNPRILLSTIKNIVNRNIRGQKFEVQVNNGTYLAYICVDNLSATKGIGSKLMQSINQSLAELNIPYMYCYMDATSLQVMRYYIKNGWTVESKSSTRSLAWYKVY